MALVGVALKKTSLERTLVIYYLGFIACGSHSNWQKRFQDSFHI